MSAAMKDDLDALESAWAARDELVCWEMTPDLIAELRRLRAENEAMREALWEIDRAPPLGPHSPYAIARKALEKSNG